VTRHFISETENVEFYYVRRKNDLMAAINCLSRLICYKEWRKYQACRVASCFNYLIETENVNCIEICDEKCFFL
jgi:hypothetical protein